MLWGFRSEHGGQGDQPAALLAHAEALLASAPSVLKRRGQEHRSPCLGTSSPRPFAVCVLLVWECHLCRDPCGGCVEDQLPRLSRITRHMTVDSQVVESQLIPDEPVSADALPMASELRGPSVAGLLAELRPSAAPSAGWSSTTTSHRHAPEVAPAGSSTTKHAPLGTLGS